jgi:glutathione S-transferase
VSDERCRPAGKLVLYRCPTPTNFLCPCGAVERRLRKLDLEHETKRVPQRRSARPEIEELTRQRRVPVLVDGDEVVYDSKRILQYLDWRYAKSDSADAKKDE